jgi:hypothetical protein
MPERLEPSFTSTKDKSFCARTVRTHPRSCTVSPRRDSPPSAPYVYVDVKEEGGHRARQRVRVA